MFFALYFAAKGCIIGQRSVIGMKIAVTHEQGKIFQHFGHTEEFKVYQITDGKIVSSGIIRPTEGGHGALAGFLLANGVDTLICGGIGAGARTALSEAGIKLYPGAEGNCDEAVAALLDGNLSYQPDIQCNHHHDEGHGCQHNCGEDKHGCGGNH